MTASPLLICCGALRPEVEALLARGCLAVQPRFLDSSLCCDYRALAKALHSALSEETDRPRALAFGLCHPAIDDLTSRYAATRVRASSCVAMLIGEDAFARSVARGHYFLLPEWTTRWREVIAGVLGLDPSTARELLAGEVARAIYLDTGVAEYPASCLQDFMDFSGLDVERQPVDLQHLAALLTEVIDDSRSI